MKNIRKTFGQRAWPRGSGCIRRSSALFAAFLAFILAGACTAEKAGPAASAGTAAYGDYAAVDKAAAAAENDESNYATFKKSNGSKFRVAVMRSGEYFSYADVLEGTLKGLMTIGWIKEIPPLMPGFNGYAAYPDGKTEPNILAELSKYDYSDFLEFPKDAFFDLKWDDGNAKKKDFKRLTAPDSGIDLIIALGTQMSAILAKPASFPIPVIVDSISDPVGSGILASLNDSGRDFLTGAVDPEQDLRQIRLFYSVIKFKRLGILYENSEIGRAYGAVEDVHRVAKEEGFQVIASTDVSPDPENEDDDAAWEAAEARYVSALDALCPKVDAVYLAVQAGLSENSLPAVVAVLNKHKTPSFIMEGKNFVKGGILLGESDSNLVAKGIFNAKKIVNIFKGKKARTLPQVYEHVPHIAINLDATRVIGYDVPIDIIASADEVFSTQEASE
jgi:ABC-type uncharacterized transport system substrate-binding protein